MLTHLAIADRNCHSCNSSLMSFSTCFIFIRSCCTPPRTRFPRPRLAYKSPSHNPPARPCTRVHTPARTHNPRGAASRTARTLRSQLSLYQLSPRRMRPSSQPKSVPASSRCSWNTHTPHSRRGSHGRPCAGASPPGDEC
jgi:hypothetical protein